MKRVCVILGLVLAVAGCSSSVNRLTLDGQLYSGSAKADRSDRAAFVAQAGPVSASLDNARQAAAYEAVKYCINYLGTSDIVWDAAPDAPADTLTIDNDKLVVQGRCVER